MTMLRLLFKTSGNSSTKKINSKILAPINGSLVQMFRSWKTLEILFLFGLICRKRKTFLISFFNRLKNRKFKPY